MNAQWNEFVAALKEEALPGIWSKGVQFSRAVNSVEFLSNQKDEWKFKIKTPERMLAFSVTLWNHPDSPGSADSHCNCGSKIEPCHHIVAIALSMQNGTVQLEKTTTQPRLEYQWKTDETKETIELQRWVNSDSGKTLLTLPLMSLLGGIQSGRIPGKLPVTSSLDLRIDEILNRSTFPSPATWKELFDALSELPPISGLTVLSSSTLPRLKLWDASGAEEGILLEMEAQSPADAIFNNGIERVGSVLRIRPADPPFRIPSSIAPSQYPKFLTESLPLLGEYFEILNESTRLPKLVHRDPFVDFNPVPLKDGTIALTPAISYGTLAPGELAIQDRAQELELIRNLRQNHHLGIGKTVFLSPREFFRLRNLTPVLKEFSKNYFTNLLEELEVQYSQLDLEKQEDTILHLLELKTQDGFKPQARVIARSLLMSPKSNLMPSDTQPKIPLSVPEKLWNQLRDYQKQGVHWLSERSTSGAILADDMGLGKTVQTLALAPSPTLIVAPTSLLHNWKNEVERFRPDLRVNLYHGSQRQWEETADLTITSYGILRAEVEKFIQKSSEKPWKMMVLDEAHLIRNQETLAAQAVCQVPALQKIALTGTPIQNRQSDLFSLFQFVSPGLFQSETELRPDRVAPFILRRRKEEVLKELPPKTHLLHEVEITESERIRYDAVWAAAKAEILSMIDASRINPLTIFETLLRSRQACDHAGLFYEPAWNESSSKLSYLIRLLKELTEAGHSVLVYSQWTRFLDRIEVEISASLSFERLDGGTTNRGAVVEKFQNSAEAKVFLLSLHAGGVGLNLTRATHVIFCDPWWNPFVELQAEDRAYRMGQEKPVTIHRLICENTIEEKILKIQEEKKKIGEATLGEAVLNKTDLLNLIRD